jgi:vacuolar protein sorting-associated protein VTA1
MKELLDDNDAVTNEVAGQAYVENFALNVFSGADDEDRAGKATK